MVRTGPGPNGVPPREHYVTRRTDQREEASYPAASAAAGVVKHSSGSVTS